jgi:hypothetical protein
MEIVPPLSIRNHAQRQIPLCRHTQRIPLLSDDVCPGVDAKDRVPENNTENDPAVQEAGKSVIVPEFGDAGWCEEAEGEGEGGKEAVL